jgi:WD40 repeat protein
VNWLNGEIIASLYDDNDDSNEKITNFCIHNNDSNNSNNGLNIVVATSRFLLHHYTYTSSSDNDEFVKIRTIKGHQMPILTMEYDSTGTLVATGSADKTIKVIIIINFISTS